MSRPLQPLWTLHTRDPESTARPRCAHFVSPPHCRVCVRHSRAGRMRAQNAVLPHSHGEGPQVIRNTRTGSARRRCAVLPPFSNAKVRCLRGIAASPKVHHGTAAPLESWPQVIRITGPGLESRYCRTQTPPRFLDRYCRSSHGRKTLTTSHTWSLGSHPHYPRVTRTLTLSPRPVLPAQDRVSRLPGRHTLTAGDSRQQEDQGFTTVHAGQTRPKWCTPLRHVGNWARRCLCKQTQQNRSW